MILLIPGQKIDFEAMKYLDQLTFYAILSDFPYGIRLKCYQKYKLWREQNSFTNEIETTISSRSLGFNSSSSKLNQVN